ncbi:MAG TPA: hypothetical protein VIJ93_01385 [bacterium]
MKQTQKLNFFLAVLFIGTFFPVWAGDNPNDYLHSRTYLGIMGTSISVNNGGLFTGTNYSRINTPYEVDLIPSLAQNFGFGVLVGHREEAYAMEVSYLQSNHLASFGPAILTGPSGPSTFTGTAQESAVYNSVNVDFKRYFLTELEIQPFLNLGVSFPWMVVPNAAEDSLGNFSSLTLAGLGLNVGIGVEYYLTPNFSFLAGATQRWASFDQFKGLSNQYNQLVQNGSSPSDEGSGLNFTIGTTVGFQ